MLRMLLLFIFPSLCLALDTDRLWLPKKHHKHYVGLLKAAEKAESIERCESVLEGTLDLAARHQGHPIFRILCRQANGRSYNEMVDGLTFELLVTPELLKQEQLANLKSSYWNECRNAVKKEARMMTGLVWLTTEEPSPLNADEVDLWLKEYNRNVKMTYCIDFNATTLRGSKLKYRAMCDIDSNRAPEITIKKR